MWIFLSNSMLSIVADRNDPSMLLVRARRKGDIGRVFDGVKEKVTRAADYRYRASVERERVSEVIARRVLSIAYENFKGSTREHHRHDAYMGVWLVMRRYQDDEKPNRRRSRKQMEAF